jgi:hypothetical protein
MAIIANIVNILGPQAGLAIYNALSFRMWLAEQKRNHRLHTTASEKCRWVITQYKWSPLNDCVTV